MFELSKLENKFELDSKFLANAVRLMMRDIFDRFKETGTLSEDDQEFCDKLDWYPVDELPLREEYVEKLKKVEKGPHSKMTLEALDKLLGLK